MGGTPVACHRLLMCCMSRGFAESKTGRRARNEDSFCVRPDLGLYVVADGMGGQRGGDVASRIVVDTLERFFDGMEQADTQSASTQRETAALVRQRLDLAVRMCQQEVARHAVGSLQRMGSTVAAVLVRGEQAVIAHVGDSRVYRLRGERLERLTRDHSLVAELEAVRGEAVGGHQRFSNLLGSWRSLLTRSVAVGCNARPDFRVETVESGDRYLLCSDGLLESLSDDQIEAVLVRYDAEEACTQLVARAYGAGSSDNISVVVVDAAPSA